MTANGTKQSFSDHNRNDRFRVLSGSLERKCLLLGVERTLRPTVGYGCF